ncbi:MAG: GNAT family N-acetyltransferase [Candidatus Thalassarchaeaceae archaeon]|jgi:ribosomal-protein-serine acetyltransferase
MSRVAEELPKPFKFELPYQMLMVEEGLELLQINLEHKDELFSLIDLNRNYLREWLPWLDDIQSLKDLEKHIYTSINEYLDGQGISYSIKFNDKIIGNISLNWIDYNNRSCGVGYWISENYRGHGFITKCCYRLMQHCFNDLQMHRFVLEVATENTPSISVAQRLGMRLEGLNIDREWLYDRYVDSNIYAITCPEFNN